MSRTPTLPAGAFLGDTLSSRVFPGFALFSTRYAPATRLARHDHERASICLVRAGAYEEDYGREVCAFGRGAAVFHPSGDHHSNVHACEEVRLLVIEFEAQFLEELQSRIDVLRERGSACEGALAALGARLDDEAHRSDAASSLACEGLVMEIIAGAARAAEPRSAKRPAWLCQVEAALRDGGREATSLSWLAALAGVHPTQLARVFRREHGCSVGAYKRKLMLEEARRRLETTDESPSAIALQCGFSDQSHLTRAFSTTYGAPPGRFRAEVARRLQVQVLDPRRAAERTCSQRRVPAWGADRR